MDGRFPYERILNDLESLVRITGQARYFQELFPRLLSDYAEASGNPPLSDEYLEAGTFLWLAGWFVSDFAGGGRLADSMPWAPYY